MAGLERKKTGTNQTSWEFYIAGNPEWLEKTLKTDREGQLVGPDGKTPAYSFRKGETVKILSLDLEKISGKDFAKVNIGGITGWTILKNISKPTTLERVSDEGYRTQEVQEHTVVQAINDAVAANAGEPIDIIGMNRTK